MKIISEDKNFIFDNSEKRGLKRRVKIILSAIHCAFYKFYLSLFYPRKRVEKKYNVSICAIFKNESLYLREWLEFHKLVGVQHFYLYNNNSDDGFMNVLQPYINNGEVDLIDWPYNQAQMEAYKDCISRFSKATKWLGFIDIDEFVNPLTADNVYDILKGFERKSGAVMLYWKVFGTSGLIDRKTNGLVVEDFTVCWNKPVNIGKCFYNTNFGFDLDYERNSSLHHFMWTSLRGVNVPPTNIYGKICSHVRHKMSKKACPMQINHYFTKSYNEYLAKKSKGDVFFKINPHDEEYFYYHEMKCNSQDYTIYKYLIKLKQRTHIR